MSEIRSRIIYSSQEYYATRINPVQNLKECMPDGITTIGACQNINLIYKQFDVMEGN